MRERNAAEWSHGDRSLTRPAASLGPAARARRAHRHRNSCSRRRGRTLAAGDPTHTGRGLAPGCSTLILAGFVINAARAGASRRCSQSWCSARPTRACRLARPTSGSSTCRTSHWWCGSSSCTRGMALDTRPRGPTRAGPPRGRAPSCQEILHAYPAPGAVTGSLLAWLRLVQTMSLVWLVPYALRNPRLRVHPRLPRALLTFEVGRAIIDALLSGNGLGDPRFRLEGSNSENATGLLAALLIVVALHSPVPRRWVPRIHPMFCVGAVALVMTRSLGSIVAVTLTLAIFGFPSPRTSEATHRSGSYSPRFHPHRTRRVHCDHRREGRQPADVRKVRRQHHRPPGGPGDRGVRPFHRQSDPGCRLRPRPEEVVTSHTLNDRFRQRFNEREPELLLIRGADPGAQRVRAGAGRNRSARTRPADHASVRVPPEGRYRPATVAPQPRLHAPPRCAAALLVVILFWWNDNGLYGAQPESVIAATLLGLLAPSRSRPRRPARRGGRTTRSTQ